jgi:hypothetical protein
MAKYQMTVTVKPVDGDYGEISTFTVKAGKQRLQNLFKTIVHWMENQKR